MHYIEPQSHDTDSNWGLREWGRGEMGEVQRGLVVPRVLPDFRTNVNNGHEERIKHHEQTEEWTERREARAQMQVGTMMTNG